MNLKVIKYGGTSVGSIEKVKKIAEYLEKRICEGQKIILVVSAMDDETNQLVEIAYKVSANPNKRELDRLVSTGEMKSIAIMAMALHDKSVNVVSLTGEQLQINTSISYQEAKIKSINTDLIMEKLQVYDCLVVAGFQGVNENLDVTTLGRGGSDTTAVAIASALNVECEIYTDVAGIYTIDPRIYPKARKLDYISYEEMNELSTLGASVMHNRSIALAMEYKTKIYVAKSLAEGRGTNIMSHEMMEKNVVTAISVDKETLSTSIRYAGVDENQEQLLIGLLTDNEINIDMISQVYFDDQISIAFTCSKSDQKKLEEVLEKINKKDILEIKTSEYAKLSLVGSGMREACGVVKRIFSTLNKKNIKFYQVTTSEITISLLIEKENVNLAVESLVIEFGLGEL